MKRCIRMISLFMAAVMALSISVIASAEGETVKVNEHFENEVSTSVWTGGYEISGGVNKYITSAADGTQFYCRLGETVSSGALIVSYDVMMPSCAGVRIKQVWDSESGGKRAYLLQSTSAGKITLENTEVGIYTPGKWFNLTEVVDVTNKKVAVYFDGAYKGEYDWRASGEAVGINNIQTQYDANTVYVDNAYVAAYADEATATAALNAMFAKKISLAKSDFTVESGKTVQNAITPVTSGAVIASYDIKTTGKARLMQIYDNQSSPKRAVLVQLNTAGAISVNGNSTGVTWTHNTPNNLTLIYDAENKTSTVYYNHVQAGAANYAVHSDGGLNLADIRTQDESSGLSVSNAWAKSFASYNDAVEYYNAVCDAYNEETAAHYNVSAEVVSSGIDDYGRALDSVTYTDTEKRAIISKMSVMLPYTNIFSENFDAVTELTGYTVADSASLANGAVRLTNSGSKARLLKQISGCTSLITECDFMQETRSNVDSIVRITDSTGNAEAIKVFAEYGDIKMFYGSGSEGVFNTKLLVSNYNANQWYNIKVYANIDAKTVSVYVDDVFLGTYAFMSSEINNLNRVFDSYTNTAGTYYIDNVKVYNDSILEAASKLTVASKVTEKLVLPSTVGEYDCSWSSSNTDAISNDGTVVRPETASENITLTATVSNGVVGAVTKFATRAAAEKDFEIGRVIYADSNGFSIETRAGAVEIKRVYLNKNNDEISGSMIVAMYGSLGELIKAEIVDANEGECTRAISITDSVDVIKIFVWDKSLENVKPLAASLTIN